jgi:hypothetical protein
VGWSVESFWLYLLLWDFLALKVIRVDVGFVFEWGSVEKYRVVWVIRVCWIES